DAAKRALEEGARHRLDLDARQHAVQVNRLRPFASEERLGETDLVPLGERDLRALHRFDETRNTSSIALDDRAPRAEPREQERGERVVDVIAAEVRVAPARANLAEVGVAVEV